MLNLYKLISCKQDDVGKTNEIQHTYIKNNIRISCVSNNHLRETRYMMLEATIESGK